MLNQYHRLYICKLVFSLMPTWGGSGLCVRIRNAMLRWAGVELGKNAHIAASVVFRGNGRIKFGDNVNVAAGVKFNAFGDMTFGDNVTIGEDAYFQTQGKIIVGNNVDIYNRTLVTSNGQSCVTIGDNCKIAHMVSLKTTGHEIDPNGECIGATPYFKDIHIGNGCWICAGAIIIPGVNVGNRCVIAAGAVVTKDVPDYSLSAGVPAVVKKTYAAK